MWNKKTKLIFIIGMIMLLIGIVWDMVIPLSFVCSPRCLWIPLITLLWGGEILVTYAVALAYRNRLKEIDDEIKRLKSEIEFFCVEPM